MAEINPTAAVVLGLLALGPAPSTEGYGGDYGYDEAHDLGIR